MLEDEEKDTIKPSASLSITRGRSNPFSTDKSESKRKADTKAEAGAADGQKRLRLAEPEHNSMPGGHCAADHIMFHQYEVQIAAAQDKGCRVDMEDIHVIQEDARRDMDIPCRVIWTAVFDGHAGKQVAALASNQLHDNVASSGFLDASKFLDSKSPTSKQSKSFDIKTMRQAITTGFAITDQQALAQAQQHHWTDGAVCVAVWIIQDTVFVANVGDARCVLGRASDKGISHASKAVVLTKEHKALFSEERRRIEKAGGFVRNGRLQGKIEVSRSFGDVHFKKFGMSAVPDIQVFNLTGQDRFLLCGCDGFWSCFSPEDAVQAVSEMMEKGKPLKAVCNRLVNMAIRERRCKDNCSILVLAFQAKM